MRRLTAGFISLLCIACGHTAIAQDVSGSLEFYGSGERKNDQLAYNVPSVRSSIRISGWSHAPMTLGFWCEEDSYREFHIFLGQDYFGGSGPGPVEIQSPIFSINGGLVDILQPVSANGHSFKGRRLSLSFIDDTQAAAEVEFKFRASMVSGRGEVREISIPISAQDITDSFSDFRAACIAYREGGSESSTSTVLSERQGELESAEESSFDYEAFGGFAPAPPTTEKPYFYYRFDENTKASYPNFSAIDVAVIHNDKLIVINFIDARFETSDMQTQVLQESLEALAQRSEAKELMLVDVVAANDNGDDIYISTFLAYYEQNKLGPDGSKRERALMPYGVVQGEPLQEGGGGLLFDFALLNNPNHPLGVVQTDAELNANAEGIYSRMWFVVEEYNKKYANSAGPSVTHADDVSPILTDEQQARIDMRATAWDYAFNNPGRIAVTAFKGPDAGEFSGEEIAEGFAERLRVDYSVEAVGYGGNNGADPTEITFYYRIDTPGDEPLVASDGPHNISDAIETVAAAALSAMTGDWLQQSE